jgi:hypothetical protein
MSRHKNAIARSGQIAHVRFRQEERLEVEHRAEDGRMKATRRREAYALLPTVVA